MKATASMGDKMIAQKGAAKTATRTDSGPSSPANKYVNEKTPRKKRNQLTKKILNRPDMTAHLSFQADSAHKSYHLALTI